MAPTRRRVSYVIPPPSEPVPRLQLPPCGFDRLGAIGPNLIERSGGANETKSQQKVSKWSRHPRHRLAVSSLALDMSTQLTGRGAPEGILYSGGRDGFIISWDLGIPMKKRKVRTEDALRRCNGKWEIMTGWVEDLTDEETEGEERPQSDGDVLGDVIMNRKRQRKISTPYESKWEMDAAAHKPGKHSEFRQCAQGHTDWINDILLCNYNQTVVSASSDGTVKAWNPHNSNASDPTTIGTHSDYVRCLSHSREQNWIASGSFDRTIKLWDLSRTEQHDPIVTLNPPDANLPKCSIYAIAADPYGTTIASGSPERVVRLWDPRSGKRTAKFVGHTDNIRSILISEDGKYLLTGSADASIKLWSLSSQRCLHTFTHHTDSVWSLHSSHRSLEIFYSGDRSGLVCRVDVEGCADISEGECILLCQDTDSNNSFSDGINKVVAMDENLLWTASGHSSIKRWKVPARRSDRADPTEPLLTDPNPNHPRTESPVPFGGNIDSSPELSFESSASVNSMRMRKSYGLSVNSLSSDFHRFTEAAATTLYGIPFDSLVRLISPNEPISSSRSRDPEVATLYSAASIMSVPRAHNSERPAIPTAFRSSSGPVTTSPHQSPLLEDGMPRNTARLHYEERELASDAVPLLSDPEDVITGEHGLVRSIILNDRVHALTVDTSGEVAVWDIIRCKCLGRFTREDVSTASTTSSCGSCGERERSPREVLEVIRERIEGEAVVSSWANADTKAGVLVIHLTERSFEAEVYADEVGYDNDRRFNDESKINLGKWVLRNLFLGFIKEEQRIHPEHKEQDDAASVETTTSATRQASLDLHIPKQKPFDPPNSCLYSAVTQSPKMIPAVAPTSARPTRASSLLTPMIPLFAKDATTLSPIPSNDATPVPRRMRSATLDNADSTTSSVSDYSSRTRQPSGSGAISVPDDLSGWSGPGKADAQNVVTPGGGLMGRLKKFGNIGGGRRPTSEISVSTTAATPVIGTTAAAEAPIVPPKSPAEILLSGALSPPPSSESPTYRLPDTTPVLIAEEASPAYLMVYRGTVSSTKHDLRALEQAMPMWLMEYLLLNKTPPVTPAVKISFVLLPWPATNPMDQLPELLNTTQSKLTASRYLRAKKLVIHVQEKLEKLLSPEELEKVQAQNPLDVYEILCNDVLLPPDMSLAAIRQFVWKQSAELVVHYRRKSPQVAALDTDDEEIP